MSWSGSYYPGAMRDHRAAKRARAAERRHGCPGKHVFTEEEAKRALLDAQIARVIRGREKRRETRSYWCRHCDGWHLTSKPDRQEAMAS